MNAPEHSIFGHFDAPGDKAPAFDPGLGVPCPFCLQPVETGALKTISLMPLGGSRSYFYRAHKNCYERASLEDATKLESSIID